MYSMMPNAFDGEPLCVNQTRTIKDVVPSRRGVSSDEAVRWLADESFFTIPQSVVGNGRENSSKDVVPGFLFSNCLYSILPTISSFFD